jgi:hypothetical protein
VDEKLNFPVITGEPSPPSIRTLDEIDQWIQEDYETFFNQEVYEKQKREMSVNVPFRL